MTSQLKNLKTLGLYLIFLAKNSSIQIINYNNNTNNIRLSNIDFSLSDIKLISQDFNFTVDDIKI